MKLSHVSLEKKAMAALVSARRRWLKKGPGPSTEATRLGSAKKRVLLTVLALLCGWIGVFAVAPTAAQATTCGPYGHWTGTQPHTYTPGRWCARGINGTVVNFQGDGNLVVTQSGRPVWSSGTVNKGATSITFARDGNLIINKGLGRLWTSNTGGHPQTAAYSYYLYVGDYVGCNGRGVQFQEAQMTLNKKKIWGSYCHA